MPLPWERAPPWTTSIYPSTIHEHSHSNKINYTLVRHVTVAADIVSLGQILELLVLCDDVFLDVPDFRTPLSASDPASRIGILLGSLSTIATDLDDYLTIANQAEHLVAMDGAEPAARCPSGAVRQFP